MAEERPPQRRTPRSTALEVERRVNYCVERLSIGIPRRMILGEISDKFGASNSQADDYLARARQILVEQFNESREQFVASQLAALEHLAHIAAEGKQYSAAAGARATMARMVGVDAPKQSNK